MIKEIKFAQFPMVDQLASYQVFGNWSPAVYKKTNLNRDTFTYGIRILVGRDQNFSNGNTRTTWSYFELDSTGLITESPRGMAKQFNKKVRITDMEFAVEHYKEKHINE